MPALTAATLSIRPQAIAAAQTRGALLAEQGYVFEFCTIFEEAFTVTTPSGEQYKGWLPGGLAEHPEGKCSCKQWEREKVCKHVYGALEAKHDAERYARMEAEHEARDLYAIAVAACVGAGPLWDKLGPSMITSRVITDTVDARSTSTATLPAAWPTCKFCGEPEDCQMHDENVPDGCYRCEKRYWGR